MTAMEPMENRRKDLLMKNYLIIAALVMGLVSAACGGSQGDSSAGTSDPAGELSWYQNDFDAASTEASSSGKPMLIDMYADWCGPCRTLGEQYFTSEEMKPLLSNFVLLRIDVDNPDMAQYAQRYNVSAIPCVVVAQADGTEIDRIVGTTPTVAQYIQSLQDILDKI
jgi:thiol:disulfide interchange protein